jgi:peptidoglycan hydrolase CwlO-like protein
MGGAVLFAAASFAYGQEASELVETRRAQLKAELSQLEQQISGFDLLIDKKQNEAASLERDIAIIDAEIARAKLEIKRRNLAISELAGSIEQKSGAIADMSGKIARERASLGEALRQLYEYDNTSLLELLLGYDDLSDFFVEVDTIDSLQLAIQTSFDELRTDIVRTAETREVLQGDKQEQIELRALQEIEKRQEEAKEAEKQSILSETRGEEANYRQLADTKKARAASIRSELFLLQGSPAISFEEALKHAEFSSSETGVRPAFILGIIAQESELGRNIGQCNLPEDPPRYKWQNIMKPSRDHAPYLQVTQALGLDPNSMPLSCPMRDSSGNQVGYGGAMGPAQFIPSTWALYTDAVSRITGNKPANPWIPRDAFVASGLLLRDNGAVGGRDAEHKAAAKYFAGGNWDSYLGRSYANQVLAKVEKYQEQITFLKSLAQQ